jgi:DNA-binding CsgD family transcriptional regulator
MAGAELLGRAEELAALEHLLDSARTHPGVLVFDGEAGIGKTTLWREGVARARTRGFWVLAAEPTPTETPLAFAGLGDLLDEVPIEFLKRLPPPQRRALEISLLLVEPHGESADQRAVSLAVLTLLRSIAASAPLLIAVDDLQWLDVSSLHVLAFAMRRIQQGPVGVLVTRRSDEGKPDRLPTGLEPADELRPFLERRVIGPLSLGAIQRLVTQRTGKRPSRPLLAQIYRASGGNPFYALELARAQLDREQDRPGLPIQVPEQLRQLVQERIAALPGTTQETLLIAAALSDPTVDVVREAGGGSIAKAVETGVVELEGDRIRFSHPLHASVLYAEAPAGRRQRLHRRLAKISSNPEERARHLALGADRPDADVAAEIEVAARRAAARGAPEAAAEFYGHAAQLTPPELREDIVRRRIATIEHSYVAGDVERARGLAEALLRGLPEGNWRSDVLVLLSDMEEDLREAIDLCHRAIEAAGDDDCRLAMAYITLARIAARLGDFALQVTAQQEALKHAENDCDPGTLVMALQGVGNVTVLSGGAIDEATMNRALELDRQGVGLTALHRPRFWYGMQLYWTDQLDLARPLLNAELEQALRDGELVDRLHILYPLIEVEMRAGNWDLADRLAAEGLEQVLDIGQDFLVRSIVFQCLQLAVLRGRTEVARPRIGELMTQAEHAGDRWQKLSLLSLAAFLALSEGDPAEAWRWLEPALTLQDELGRDICLGMVPLFSIRPNAIEALVSLDELDRAEELLSRFEAHVERTRRPNGLVTSARSRALVAAARGDLEAARQALERALEAHALLPDPFERGRTLLVSGTVQRRGKSKRAAREALEEAQAIFAKLGARLWLERAEAELERVGGRRSAGGELTVTELKVAELVAGGKSNKEVAATLFMSVRTVEANLAKIYRKLEIDSRAELAARFASLEEPTESPMD